MTAVIIAVDTLIAFMQNSFKAYMFLKLPNYTLLTRTVEAEEAIS